MYCKICSCIYISSCFTTQLLSVLQRHRTPPPPQKKGNIILIIFPVFLVFFGGGHDLVSSVYLICALGWTNGRPESLRNKTFLISVCYCLSQEHLSCTESDVKTGTSRPHQKSDSHHSSLAKVFTLSSTIKQTSTKKQIDLLYAIMCRDFGYLSGWFERLGDQAEKSE